MDIKVENGILVINDCTLVLPNERKIEKNIRNNKIKI
jgi:hypothetical protein